VCVLLAAILGMSTPARADDPDPWFGRDKALHFSVSAAIAGTTYAITATQFEARYPPLVLGGGVALAAGIGKETADLLGLWGDPSWRDFAWDVAGTVVGLGIAWGLDLLIRGVSARHPLFGSPSGAPEARASELRARPFGVLTW
jgi:putative lipoprotein